MRLLALLPLILLAGCAGHGGTPKSVVVTQDVLVRVPASCVPKELGAAPDYVDTDEALKAAPEGPVRYQLLGTGRGQRIARLEQLERAVRGCPKEE